jgi:D-alanyl-D-alanine carboxypeptidase (penicillin-binding protein 5/6)
MAIHTDRKADMRNWTLKCFLLYGYPLKRQELFLCSLILLTPALLFLISNSFAKTIDYRAAVVMDGSTGKVLYAKNPNRQLPPASTTKLMTAIIAIESKNILDIVEISKNASHVSPTKAGFKEGDKVTIEGLLYAALLRSANDAAVALAEGAAGSEERFVQLMNNRAIAIGATNTRFINATGLPGPGQHTTASDLSKIMLYALKYPKLKEIIGTSIMRVSTEEGKTFFIKNTDKLLWSDEEIIGGKTGFTYSAGHCFVCAAEHNTKIIILSILGSPSRKTLWKETENLLQNVLRR